MKRLGAFAALSYTKSDQIHLKSPDEKCQNAPHGWHDDQAEHLGHLRASPQSGR